GISPAFAGLSPTSGQVPTCYSPVRHSCIATGVRLACVRHAASVRSEPGSNSQVRLANPPLLAGRKTGLAQGHSQTQLGFQDALTCECPTWAPPPAHPFTHLYDVQEQPGLPAGDAPYRLHAQTRQPGFSPGPDTLLVPTKRLEKTRLES